MTFPVTRAIVMKCHESDVGDWSNGMIGVSKTFGGSSILSSPAFRNAGSLDFFKVSGIFHFPENSYKE